MIDLLCDLLAIACDWCARCVFVVTKLAQFTFFSKIAFWGGGWTSLYILEQEYSDAWPNIEKRLAFCRPPQIADRYRTFVYFFLGNFINSVPQSPGCSGGQPPHRHERVGSAPSGID